jgi:NhaA family Na+:H+ antiporter
MLGVAKATRPPSVLGSLLGEFVHLEALAGFALIGAAVAGMVLANSPLSHLYDGWITTRLEVRIGEASLEKPLLLWVNDGLMALFFTLVALELKREVLQGEL